MNVFGICLVTEKVHATRFIRKGLRVLLVEDSAQVSLCTLMLKEQKRTVL
jgi:hypothetical protein